MPNQQYSPDPDDQRFFRRDPDFDKLRDQAGDLLCAFDCFCASAGMTREATAGQAHAVMTPFSNAYCRPFDALQERRGGDDFLQLFCGKTDFGESGVRVCVVARDLGKEQFCIPLLSLSPTLQTLLAHPQSMYYESAHSSRQTLEQKLSTRCSWAGGSAPCLFRWNPLVHRRGWSLSSTTRRPPAPLKVVPLFSEGAFAEGVQTARAVSRYISVQLESGAMPGITRLPVPSTIVAILLCEVVDHEALPMGLTGISVPEDGQGEYQIGVLAGGCDAEPAPILTTYLTERVHRVGLEHDRFGFLKTSWRGDDGVPFKA